MSLLQQINERNGAQASQQAEAQAAQQAEAGKPDAVQGVKDKRSQYSNMMAQTPDDANLQDEEPTAEEQQQFTQLELQVSELVNGERANQMFKVIQAANDPVEGVGQVAHDIIKIVKQSNPAVDSEILFGIGETAVEQVVQAYEDVDPSANFNEDQMAEAFSIGLQEWMQENPQDIDPDMKDYLAGAAPDQL